MWVEKFWNLSYANYFFAPHFSTGLQTVPWLQTVPPTEYPGGAVCRNKPLWAQLRHGELSRFVPFSGAHVFDVVLP